MQKESLNRKCDLIWQFQHLQQYLIIFIPRNDSEQASLAGTFIWQKGQQLMHTREEFGAALFPSVGDIEKVEKFHSCRTACQDTFRYSQSALG